VDTIEDFARVQYQKDKKNKKEKYHGKVKGGDGD